MPESFHRLSQDRLRALVQAGIAMSSELSLESVLERLVKATTELTGARFAVLGVASPAANDLERFVSFGITDEEDSSIDDLLRGPGVLSVPILLRGAAYGHLYVAGKRNEQLFTAEDEELLQLLATQAAVAVENARLYESATGWLRQLESLNEVANALIRETDLDRLLELICRRLRELLGARLVAIGLPEGEDELRYAAADGEGEEKILGTLTPRAHSKLGLVLEHRRSERVNSAIDDPEIDVEVARKLHISTGLWVPLVVRERAIGVIMAVDRLGSDPRFSDEDLRLAEAFAARAAVAVDQSEKVARDALRRVVSAQELERRRLSRELHDETGQSLTSVLLGLKAIEEAPGSERAREEAVRVRELVTQTLHDVRRLSVELRPKALDDFGLVPALQRLAQGFSEQTGIKVEVASTLGERRLPSEVETALYRIVQEALTNVVKHARASNVSVLVTRRDGRVSAVIEDDGRGFNAGADRTEGLGLVGMEERVALLNGKLIVESTEGVGTTVVAEVPLA